MPKDHDRDLSKIQAGILACIRPLSSAWQQLLETGLTEDKDMGVPATEVVTPFSVHCV